MYRASFFWAGIILASGLPSVAESAELSLCGLFCDHAVLQRDQSVPVWGWSDPKDAVALTFAGQTKTATADSEGRWQVMLDPMPASNEGRELVVQSSQQNRRCAIADVVVGEVWYASGQSNMHWTFAAAHQVLNNEAELDSAGDPLIRQFTVRRNYAAAPVRVVRGEWHPCTRKNLLKGAEYGDSALAYFFARELRRKLGVPVGVVNASMGGTAIESWTSESIQRETPELKAMLEERAAMAEACNKEVAAYEAKLAAWKRNAAEAQKSGSPVPPAPAKVQRPQGISPYYLPGAYFNGMAAGVIPYAIRGIIWYQGESNAKTVASALLYRTQLPLLTADWRARWGRELPVAWVQLPNFNAGPGWMLVREAMLHSLAVPRTGMAIAIDIGDPKNIHPKNKQEVARRLGLWALGEVYQQQVLATSGPLPGVSEVRNGEVVISFKHTEGGLLAKDGPLKGFVIAGEDRKWKPATARIEGERVIVSSPEVKVPVAVRYAWAANPDGNLFNGAGLPASPFRTDDWPVR